MKKAIILHTHTCSRGRGGSWCPTVAVLGQHQTWTKSTVGCFDTSLALRKSIEGFTPVSFHPYPVPPPPTPSTGGGPKNSTLLFCIIENPQEMLLASRKDAWRSSCCWIFGVQERSIKREPSLSSVVYLPLLFDPVPLAST
jgi:hypothetical protein